MRRLVDLLEMLHQPAAEDQPGVQARTVLLQVLLPHDPVLAQGLALRFGQAHVRQQIVSVPLVIQFAHGSYSFQQF